MEKKYKLIKEYPGSPKKDFILNKSWSVNYPPNHYMINGLTFNPNNHTEYWEEVIEKDYEILSLQCVENPNKGLIYNIIDGNVINSHGSIVHAIDNALEFWVNTHKSWIIYSVKRLSDNEIFTIGDKVTIKGEVINEFEIINNKLKIWFVCPSYSCPSKPKNTGSITGCGNMGFNWLNTVKKLKIPLFTTEDGVNIFEGDYYFGIDKTVLRLNHKLKAVINQYMNKDFIRFSTKEKAEEYIFNNKPCLSLVDFEKIYNSTNFTDSTKEFPSQAKKLRELVKKKLNL